MTETHYMTRAQVAKHARCSKVTVYRAWILYRDSDGTRGLRGIQRNGPHSTVWFDPEDVDRWLTGEAPRSTGQTLRRTA